MTKDISMILEVPFESRKVFFPKSRCKYSYTGYVYYLIDKTGNVLRDFAILNDEHEVEHRLNDNKMMIGTSGNGTSFWHQLKQKQDRLQIFNLSNINFSIQRTTKEQIKNINELSFNTWNTALTLEGFITGSNTSGSDLKRSMTPFISVDSDFYGIRFINSFKQFKINKRNTNAYKKFVITLDEFNKYKKINLKQFFSQFPNKKSVFYNYNPESYEILYGHNNKNLIEQHMPITSKEYVINEREFYYDKTRSLINKYVRNNIGRQKLIDLLRNILRPQLLLEKSLKNKPVIEGREEKNGNLEAAHLYDVSWLKKDNDDDLWRIADINNGLLLPRDIHGKLDKDPTFDINEELEFIDNGKKTKWSVNKCYVNDNRKNYIKMRHKKLNIHL